MINNGNTKNEHPAFWGIVVGQASHVVRYCWADKYWIAVY